MSMTLNDVGLDINTDVRVVNYPPSENARILSSGEDDALVAFPPINKELRDKGIGKVVLNSLTDQPWTNYYCCTAVTTRDWLAKHTVAVKRALRALVKAADVIAKDPDGSARFLVDKGYATDFDYTCDILKEIPYNNIWRDYDPADSVRFYALRLKRAGLIKSTPEEILERGTDFRYLTQLRKDRPAPPAVATPLPGSAAAAGAAGGPGTAVPLPVPERHPGPSGAGPFDAGRPR